MANSGFQIDESQLTSILDEVEQGLIPVLKSEANRLSKAKDEASAPPSEDEGSAPPDEGSAPAEGSAPPEASASGDAPPMASPAGPEASAPPEGAGPPPEGSAPAAAPGGLPNDPAALAEMIGKLPPEQIKAIYLASKQAIFAAQGPAASPAPAGPAGGPPPMAPPAGGPPGPEASAGGPPMPPPAMKAEMKASPGNGGKTAPVAKSESSVVDTLTDLVKKQNEKIELLTKAVTHMAGTPVRKAITGVSHIAKSETAKEARQFTKAEVNAKLTEQIRGGKLEKKEIAQIKRFFDTGSQDFNLIAPFIKE